MSTVKINALSVPVGKGKELEQRFVDRKQAVDNQPCFEGVQLLRPVSGEGRYFVLTQWRDEQSYQAWRQQDTHTHAGKTTTVGGETQQSVATSAQLLEFEVVVDSTT